jgi:hypothetical protein
MSKKRQAEADASADVSLSELKVRSIKSRCSDSELCLEVAENAYDCSICLRLVIDPVVGKLGQGLCDSFLIVA